MDAEYVRGGFGGVSPREGKDPEEIRGDLKVKKKMQGSGLRGVSGKVMKEN